MTRVKRLQPGERISIRLTDGERKLILGHTFVGGDLQRRIRVPATNGFAVVVPLDLDDLEELLGYVAAEANHSREPSVARSLGHLHERLRRIGEADSVQGPPAIGRPA
jgi:hypothetical protein